MKEPVRVGIAVLIKRDNRILLGKRTGAHGAETWAPPGGHLEFGETPEACAKREVLEETGLQISNLRRGPYTNDVFLQESKHYITLYILADCPSGEPEILEPEKCRIWQWVDYNQLPDALFLPIKNLQQQIKLADLLEESIHV